MDYLDMARKQLLAANKLNITSPVRIQQIEDAIRTVIYHLEFQRGQSSKPPTTESLIKDKEWPVEEPTKVRIPRSSQSDIRSMPVSPVELCCSSPRLKLKRNYWPIVTGEWLQCLNCGATSHEDALKQFVLIPVQVADLASSTSQKQDNEQSVEQSEPTATSKYGS